ncbi:MAG: toxic anion resistance protein, partial [Clostridia bacterium]|nr:toxic anion resistance protein [Clostridia bacterium]
QRSVTDMTNELLKQNAETLHTSTVEIAKETERGIVDMETLTHTNEQLIATLDEVQQIHAEGREKRAEAEAKLRGIENELRQKLLEVNGEKEESK